MAGVVAVVVIEELGVEEIEYVVWVEESADVVKALTFALSIATNANVNWDSIDYVEIIGSDRSTVVWSEKEEDTIIWGVAPKVIFF